MSRDDLWCVVVCCGGGGEVVTTKTESKNQEENTGLFSLGPSGSDNQMTLILRSIVLHRLQGNATEIDVGVIDDQT